MFGHLGLDDEAQAQLDMLRRRAVIELEQVANAASDMATFYRNGATDAADDPIAIARAFDAHMGRLRQITADMGFYVSHSEVQENAPRH